MDKEESIVSFVVIEDSIPVISTIENHFCCMFIIFLRNVQLHLSRKI